MENGQNHTAWVHELTQKRVKEQQQFHRMGNTCFFQDPWKSPEGTERSIGLVILIGSILKYLKKNC